MSDVDYSHSHNDQRHTHHGHTHGTIDPALLNTERGIWAVKWSLIGLASTAVFQAIIVFFSGSVALLHDPQHCRRRNGYSFVDRVRAGTAAAFAPLHLRSR